MSRADEIAEYVKAYTQPAYKMGDRRRADVRRIVSSLPAGSLLDVSTGRGETLQFASAAGHGPVAGTEVVPALIGGAVVFAEAHDLPFVDGQFDHVTCFDVLEHLTEEDIRPALREMFRVASKSVTVSASEKPSKFGAGRELHISRRPKAQWLEVMRECWGACECIGTAGASPAFQVMKP